MMVMFMVALVTFAIILIILIFFLLFYKLWFLRCPKRNIPKGNKIVSPANGKVIDIIRFNTKGAREIKFKKGLFGRICLLVQDVAKEGSLIVIMMTPLNVHYQRAPMDGRILSIKYSRGRFLNAVKDSACLSNERNEILFETKIGKIKVAQIAGFVARRICCFAMPNQKIVKGQLLGLIKLGSQVALVLPKKAKIIAKKNQKVTEGETILAKY